MGGGEGEPDRAAAAEEMGGVGGRLVVAEHPQRRRGRRDRRRAEQQVEDDHVAVRLPQGLFEGHRRHPTTPPAPCTENFSGPLEGKAAVGANLAAVTRTATKGAAPAQKPLRLHPERFDEFSRSQKDVARYIVDHLDEAAFLTAEELARRASTSSSTVVRFSQALGFDGYPELQQAAIEEYRNGTGNGERRQGDRRAARSSPSTTPSSRRRSAPTTRTSRRPRAT